MKKRIFKSIAAIIVLFLLTLTLPNVIHITKQQTATAASKVKLNKSKATIYKGKTLILKTSGTESTVFWSSNKKAVATVDKKGKVTAKATGTATITAKVGNNKLTCKVTVELTKEQELAYNAYRNILINAKDAVVLDTYNSDYYNNFAKYVKNKPDQYIFTLIDLDGDNVEELFIKDGAWDSTSAFNSWVFKYNVADKQVHNLIWDDVEGICSYNPLKNGSIVENYWYAGGSSDTFSFFKLKSDGSFETDSNNVHKKYLSLYKTDEWYRDRLEDTTVYPFEIDGKEVSEAVWNIAFKKNYTDNIIPEINWHTCSEKNIKAYISLSVNASAKVTNVKQSYKYNNDTNKQMSILKGYSKSGKVEWTYKTEWTALTELDTISPFFINGKFVYIVVDGSVIALDNNTGKVIWKTKNIAGASNHYAFDKHNTLYIGGYYGPDAIAIDKNGDILWTVKDASNGIAYWPYKIKLLDNKIEITYDTNEGYDKDTNSYFSYNGIAYIDYSGNILEYKEIILQ